VIAPAKIVGQRFGTFYLAQAICALTGAIVLIISITLS
jgi:hypothetical protein